MRRSIRCASAAILSRWPAWQELDLVGREIAIGDARLKVMKRIVRCAARANVDPVTAARHSEYPGRR